jgi:hypothetical protein
METATLIRAFGAKRARLADVTWSDQPDARKGDTGLRHQPVHDLGQRPVERSLRGHGQRDALQGFGVHWGTGNEPSLSRNDASMLERQIVAFTA